MDNEDFLDMINDELTNNIDALGWVLEDVLQSCKKKEKILYTEELKTKLSVILNSMAFDRQLIQDEIKALQNQNSIKEMNRNES